jgi:hypothetical protein
MIDKEIKMKSKFLLTILLVILSVPLIVFRDYAPNPLALSPLGVVMVLMILLTLLFLLLRARKRVALAIVIVCILGLSSIEVYAQENDTNPYPSWTPADNFIGLFDQNNLKAMVEFPSNQGLRRYTPLFFRSFVPGTPVTLYNVGSFEQSFYPYSIKSGELIWTANEAMFGLHNIDADKIFINEIFMLHNNATTCEILLTCSHSLDFQLNQDILDKFAIEQGVKYYLGGHLADAINLGIKARDLASDPSTWLLSVHGKFFGYGHINGEYVIVGGEYTTNLSAIPEIGQDFINPAIPMTWQYVIQTDYRSAKISAFSTPYDLQPDTLLANSPEWFNGLVSFNPGVSFETAYDPTRLFDPEIEIHPWEPGGWADPNNIAVWDFPDFDATATTFNDGNLQELLNGLKYDPNQFNYDPNQFNYDPNQFNYDPNQFNYDPNQFNYDPNQFKAPDFTYQP